MWWPGKKSIIEKRIEEIEKKQKDRWPHLISRIRKLEKWSHPCKELHEFEVYPELIGRIEELERRLKINKK